MSKKIYAALKSIAAYVPTRVVTNADFEARLDTSDEWIVRRTGIRERRFAEQDQTASDLALNAAKLAIERAGISAADLDLVLVASISGDYFAMPSTACVLAAKLGLTDTPAFDILAACSGYIYLLQTARAFIESGLYRNILIVGAEKLSSVLDFSDRSTCVLFGDGAGASVVGVATEPNRAILDVHISSNGALSDFLFTPRNNASFLDASSCQNKQFIAMKGSETFKIAVRTLASDVEAILAKNGVAASAVKFFIPHQANERIIKAVAEQLSFAPSQLVQTIERYGNTSAASIPMALNHVYESGALKPGDLLLFDAFGGGLTWGSALVYFDGN